MAEKKDRLQTGKISPVVAERFRQTFKKRDIFVGAFRKIATHIHDSGYKAILLEGDSSEFVWDGFMGAWHVQYPQERPPTRIKIPSSRLYGGYRPTVGDTWYRENQKKIAKYSGQSVVILADAVLSGQRLRQAQALAKSVGFVNVQTATLLKPTGPAEFDGKPIFVGTHAFITQSPLQSLKKEVWNIDPITGREVLRRGRRMMKRIGAKGNRPVNYVRKA